MEPTKLALRKIKAKKAGVEEKKKYYVIKQKLNHNIPNYPRQT
jgi:hypothetical protein